MPRQPTPSELKKLLIGAVRSCLQEDPRIGGREAREVAVSARVAMLLARTPEAVEWERNRVVADAEYGQAGLAGGAKVIRPGDAAAMRPDLIVHRRGGTRAGDNWMACEMKLHWPKQAIVINSHDKEKLKSLKLTYKYRLIIWVSLPRTSGDGRVFLSQVDEHGLIGPIRHDL
jgi:hypothetical protein